MTWNIEFLSAFAAKLTCMGLAGLSFKKIEHEIETSTDSLFPIGK